MDYVTLSNGVKMPQLGYGVYQIAREDCERCVLDALEVGYRSIDTAQAYFNEAEVGRAVERSGVPRRDVFITTKIWLEHYGEEATRESVFASLGKLRTDYIDLVLLHQPYGDAYSAWRALERLYEERVIRAIGISNFDPVRMVEFASFNRIRPMVNQIETHPHNQQVEAMKWMKKYNIQIEAWAPFGEGRSGLFDDPVLCVIARRYGKTPAQVMLRWNLQRGVVVIPKSVHVERMRENFNVFDFALDDADMAAIAQMDRKQILFLPRHDPATVEWFVRMIKERHGRA